VSRAGRQFVSRAGEKLDAALDAFEIDVSDLVCADFGCNVGGFTDCLLRRGAAKVYAVDTGYGELAWKLRRDGRVVVMERTNVLHADPPRRVSLVTVDVAWTCQEFAVPAAGRWLEAGGRVVCLLKPHYEAARIAGRKPHAPLDDAQAKRVCAEVCGRLEAMGWVVRAGMLSPLRGKGGNAEFLLLLQPGEGRAGDGEATSPK
jgi:23S rRNA (cytidine1920-2'-O)/16S rRNA (cytidine1409-2'-O)-methyltransferase